MSSNDLYRSISSSDAGRLCDVRIGAGFNNAEPTTGRHGVLSRAYRRSTPARRALLAGILLAPPRAAKP